jgi:DNA-binding NarL/FixJ family response regulator
MMKNLIIASPNEERAASWKQGLNGFVGTVKINDSLNTLFNDIVQIEPQVLLLDIDWLGLNRLSSVVNLKILSPETRIIILSGAISEDFELELFKAGVRGCCRHEISSDLLKQVVMAVQQGELWIRSNITGRLADELGNISSRNKAYQASHDLLNKLTQREYDIALHCGKRGKQ